MKIIPIIFLTLFLGSTAQAQTNDGFWIQWRQPDRGPLLYEVCHGSARGIFSVHPHATFQTNIFIPTKALWTGENWFAVTAVDTDIKSENFTLEPRETDFSNWIVIRSTPAVVIGGSTNGVYESSSNLVDWVTLTNRAPIPMVEQKQFFRGINDARITIQNTNVVDFNNTP